MQLSKAAMSSWRHSSCHIQKTGFHGTLSHTPAIAFFKFILLFTYVYMHVCHLYRDTWVIQNKYQVSQSWSYWQQWITQCGSLEPNPVHSERAQALLPTKLSLQPSGSYILSALSSTMLPGPFSFRGWHWTITYSQHYDQLWVCSLTILHSRKPDLPNMSQATVKSLQCWAMIFSFAHIPHKRKILKPMHNSNLTFSDKTIISGDSLEKPTPTPWCILLFS